MAYIELRLIIEELDVIKTDHFENPSKIYKNKTIDILINNAGNFSEDHLKNGIQSTTYEEVTSAFVMNSVGSFLSIQHFESLLLQSDQPKIVIISSQISSLASAKGFWICLSYVKSSA